jgi:hypothetical protein
MFKFHATHFRYLHLQILHFVGDRFFMNARFNSTIHASLGRFILTIKVILGKTNRYIFSPIQLHISYFILPRISGIYIYKSRFCR